MNTRPLNWFNAARYGMFIHYGPYSVGARGEWIANREHIPKEEYAEKYVRNFHAEHYDPAAWASLAAESGMKYVVLTTRHHDGFCLWDTRTTDFNAVNLGPKRDLVRPFVEAVRKAGLKVGFYFSVVDWYHPDYPGAFWSDWPKAWPSEEQRKRFVRYYQSQVEELMTQYGKIDMLWYDGGHPEPIDGAAVNARVRELQPGILINNRNGDPGCDFQCCEQAIHPSPPGVSWEACMTLNDNWGYHAGDQNWKQPGHVIRLLTETAAGAGNLLLNVGPQADGTIPKASVEIIRAAGDWLKRNGEFLPNSSRSPFAWNNWGKITTKENRMYLHILDSPGTELCVPDIKNRVLSARYMESGKPMPFIQQEDRLFLKELPVPLPDPIATTLVLEVEGTPESLQ